ncbi:tpaF [Nocardiopsis suaedae]|uniref:TpaF n=1 Tax=Nocardiopsis suaedae TaxID=3018444 RepID=A0ABT4TJV1_9ACTN|nr:tpaF [Nocardiopsis suaedae]MDA2804666.1 tpaF [Nocardiopsis suaedae]
MRTDHTTMLAVLEGLASRTPTGDGKAAAREPAPFPSAEEVDIDLSVSGGEPERDLYETLSARRSTLRYSPAPVRTGPVLRLAQEALARDEEDWGEAVEAGPLEAFVFALRSEGLPEGVYRVTAEGCARVAPPDSIGDPEDLGVQREFATGAGIVTLFAGLDRADAWAGPHGYRSVVVRAAMATYDIHLKLQAHGLVGTVFGGFIAAAVRAAAKSDGVTRHPLLSTTYAHRPDS